MLNEHTGKCLIINGDSRKELLKFSGQIFTETTPNGLIKETCLDGSDT